jgi:predicted dithiol-disulfide oxidoreductase (DUF899 family)
LLPLAEGPCPSCTALLDQLDGAAEHASQHVNLVVAAKAPLERILTFAAERGWRRLRLLSSAGTTYATSGARNSSTHPSIRGKNPPRRHHRAALEPVRLHPRGPPSHLA